MFALFLTLFVPNVALLGADEWGVREAETLRCDNPISALLLPARHEDPEIDCRIRQLRRKWILRPELDLMRASWERWVDEYFVTERTRLEPEHVFGLCFGNKDRYRALLARFPIHCGIDPCGSSFFWTPALDTDYPRFLRWLDYHFYRAPMPHEPEK